MPKNKKHEDDTESDFSDADKEEEKKESLLDRVKENEKKLRPHEKKEEVEPETDEAEDEPPYVVVVQGPKKSGKTTLIQSLVKHYTRHKLTTAVGNITLRSGRNRRITLIECPNDINGMIDLAKVADLCLILVDASVGFEMQTFEFLSILKSHGFPNVMGVLTHLDFFKENKSKRNTRKALKRRFAQEVGENFKLFHLQGLKYDLYHKADVVNLARFISVMKMKQPEWKSIHPHIVVDRYENLTDGRHTDEDNCKIAFFGYIRGCSYRFTDNVHITGLGAPNEELEGDGDATEAPKDELGVSALRRSSKKKRNLKQNEKIIYAPMSNLGFLNYEQSSGYITIPDKHVMFTRVEEEQVDEFGNKIKVTINEDAGEGIEMVRKMQDMKRGIDEILADEEEPELLAGIKLDDSDDEKEEKKEDKEDLFEQRKKNLQEAKSRSLAAIEQYYKPPT
jgi:ribosome biogenesis protein BMS1